jgi:hypothetical protein
MEVAPASTAPFKRVAKAIIAENPGLDFADKVRPRASNSLHALSGCQCYAQLYTLKNFTLLFLGQGVVFDAYNLLIRKSLLQWRW